MTQLGRSGLRTLALASVTVIGLAGGVAWAQGKSPPAGVPQVTLPTAKPPPLGAPQVTLPTAKPPPLGAPAQAQPVPPPAAQPPAAQPSDPAPAAQPSDQAPPAKPPTPPPAAQPPASAPKPPSAAVPANEPAAITRLRQMLGDGVGLTYATAEARDAAGEDVRLTGLVLQQEGKRATAEEATITGLRADGVTEAVITGFTAREEGNELRIGRLRLAGIVLPPGAGGDSPDPEKIRIEAVNVQNLAITGEIHMRLSSASLENWIAGQPTRFVIEGLELTGLDGGVFDALRLARFSISGFDLAGVTAAVMRNEPAPTLPGRSAMELDRLELAAGARPVGGLAELRLVSEVTSAEGAGTGRLVLRGIRIEPIPLLAPWLTRLGYQAIEADITAEGSYDPASGRNELRDLSIAVRDAGTLTFSLVLDGLTREQAQRLEFDQVRLITMGLRYTDASLFRRFVAMQAAETRTPEPQLREQYAAMVGGPLSQPGATALDPIRDALQRFIRGEARTIEIRAKPPRPVSVGQLQGGPPASPEEVRRLFGIVVDAR
jgi:hypothetical protein